MQAGSGFNGGTISNEAYRTTIGIGNAPVTQRGPIPNRPAPKPVSEGDQAQGDALMKASRNGSFRMFG